MSSVEKERQLAEDKKRVKALQKQKLKKLPNVKPRLFKLLFRPSVLCNHLTYLSLSLPTVSYSSGRKEILLPTRSLGIFCKNLERINIFVSTTSRDTFETSSVLATVTQYWLKIPAIDVVYFMSEKELFHFMRTLVKAHKCLHTLRIMVDGPLEKKICRRYFSEVIRCPKLKRVEGASMGDAIAAIGQQEYMSHLMSMFNISCYRLSK